MTMIGVVEMIHRVSRERVCVCVCLSRYPDKCFICTVEMLLLGDLLGP